LLHGSGHLLGELRKLARFEELRVIMKNFPGEAVEAVSAIKLQEEAFAKVLRPDTRRIQRLNSLQAGLNVSSRSPSADAISCSGIIRYPLSSSFTMMLLAAFLTCSGTIRTLSWHCRRSLSVTGDQRNVSNEAFSTDSAEGLLKPGSR